MIYSTVPPPYLLILHVQTAFKLLQFVDSYIVSGSDRIGKIAIRALKLADMCKTQKF